MDMKRIKEVTKIVRDKLLHGGEYVLLYVREEGGIYEPLFFRSGHEAYDVIERYKKTGELEIVTYKSLGRVTEVIRPVTLMVTEVKYGLRPEQAIVSATSED